MAAKSQIRIGSKIMFGPQVVLIGGGHNTSLVGHFMVDVHDKRSEDDMGVVIEDDVWVGARAIILRHEGQLYTAEQGLHLEQLQRMQRGANSPE